MARRIILYVVYGVVVVGLIVAIIFAFHGNSGDKKPTGHSGNSQSQTAQGQNGSTSSQSSSGGHANQQATSQTGGKGNANSTKTASGSQASPQLANTGPGETAVLFVAVSTLAAIGFWGYQRRQVTTQN